MKKLLIIVMSLFLLTGCSVTSKNLNNMTVSESVDYVLSKNINLYNVNNIGYRYYLPRGYKVISDIEYNEVLYTENYKYYLYIDTIKYFNEVSSDFEEKEDYYLSKALDYKGKEGYINIKKVGKKFYIEMVYNYAKIEVVVNKEDIKEAVINASCILSSIRFNKNVIENKVGDEVLDFKEKKFQLKKPKNADDNRQFLEDFEKYATYKEKDNELQDTDIIGN